MADRHTTPPIPATKPAATGQGTKTHQVGESEPSDQETTYASGDRADYEYARRGHEERVAFGVHRGSDQGHRNHQRRRQSRNRPAIAACERNDEARSEISEQHQANPLSRIRGQRSGKYETPESNLSNEEAETRSEARRQRRNRFPGKHCRSP